MLQDTLSKIENVLSVSNLLSDKQVLKLCSKFQNYESGKFVYPSMVKRHLGVRLETAYHILNQLVDAGILKVCIQLQCSKDECNEIYRESFDEINEIPVELSCEYCGNTFNILKDTRIIFKVI